MKKMTLGIAGILAIGAAMPALANPATTGTVVQTQPAAYETTTTTTRTIVVRETPLYGQQIVAALQGKEDASAFRQLMAANGISKSLREDGKGYTAFVPVNHAFSTAGVSIPSGPAPDGTVNPQVRALLENHIVDKKFDVNLLHGNRDNLTALNGEPLVVSKAGPNYYVNGKLIVSRQHDPEGIIYFIEDIVTSGTTTSAVYNPADVRK